MKVIAIGADISSNDVSVSKTLISNIENNIYRIKDLGAEKVGLTNITGDDVVVSAFVEDYLIEDINNSIVDVLRDCAEDIGDLKGISKNKKEASEGISYAEAKVKNDKYPDAVILAFDTYAGENFVDDIANSAIEAASGMKNLSDISQRINDETKEIPGLGFVSNETDDPVVVATIEDMESVGAIAGAMVGAALGNKNVYLVERGTPSYVIPGSAILSVSAFLNGNIMDLAIPFNEKTRILR
ncbi:MAG: hypothetical protein LBB45_02120 [Methanobrevibacter sp.]|jgi:hypothetical protein|nr:hypothetical protein [Candidatus Methanovirga basalitermitum]